MRLRHATVVPPIDGPQWNESHVLAAHDLGNVGGEVLVVLEHGSVQLGRLVANTTFVLPPVAAGTTEHLSLILSNDAAGGRAVTVAGVSWIGGAAPVFDTAAGAKNIIVLRGVHGQWIGDGGVVA